MPSRRLVLVATAVAALLFSACGGDGQKRGADSTTPPTVTTTEATMHDMTTVSGSPTTAAADMKFTVVAKNIAFEPNKLTIPVNKDVDIILDNQDASVPHNIHFLTPKEVHTDTKNGVSKTTAHLNVDKAGTYKFFCDVHPTMTGELTVS